MSAALSENISIIRNDIIREIFVKTADENYITARWCKFNNLNYDFLWLSLHSIEKYLKAVLLMNGQSVKNSGHNIVDLYGRIKLFAKDLLDGVIDGEVFNAPHLNSRSPDGFIEHLWRDGNPHNRYAIDGYVTSIHDLRMLDMIVFSVRRLVCELDEQVLDGSDPQMPTLTYRELLASQPRYYRSLNMPLDKLISSKGDQTLRYFVLNQNRPFAPMDFHHGPLPASDASSNPVIVHDILDPLASNQRDYAAEGLEIARWLLANVKVPPDVEEQIRDAMNAACGMHGLP